MIKQEVLIRDLVVSGAPMWQKSKLSLPAINVSNSCLVSAFGVGGAVCDVGDEIQGLVHNRKPLHFILGPNF